MLRILVNVLKVMFGTGVVEMRVLVSHVAWVHTKIRGSARFVLATQNLLSAQHIVNVKQESSGSMKSVRGV